MRKARIENERVVEILDSGIKSFPPFHADLIWVECSSNVRVNDTYNGTNFLPYTAPSKTQTDINKEAKEALIAIDLASIRAIREYIVARADAPQVLMDREEAAIAERAKIV